MPSLKVISITVIWLTLFATAYYVLLQYDFKSSDSKLSKIPRATQLPISKQGPTLIAFLHAKCPCSRASINEIDRLLTSHGKDLKTIFVFSKEKDLELAWIQESELYKKAQKMSVEIIIDPNNSEAKVFKAQTSGKVFLVSPKQEILFQGGVTASRGHEGNNSGITAIQKILAGKNSQIDFQPSFGCLIYSS